MKETQKVSRADRERKRRVAPKSKYKKARRIIREAPPKAEKKAVLTTEMVRNPNTGKMEKKEVYKLQEVKDPKREKKLAKNLYIPKEAPEKERRYLRFVPPQFRDATKRYENPNKYGDLSLYKKSRLMQIAKDKYDLTEALAKHLDKEDLQRYIKKRYKKADTFSDKDYLPTKIKLRKVEPIRDLNIKYDPNRGFDAVLSYGKGGSNAFTGETKPGISAFEDLNRKFKKKKNIVPFGEYRKMNEKKYKKFMEGKLPIDEIQAELLTHLNILDPSIILTLDDKQLNKLYKKAYKLDQKKPDEKFSKQINFPKFKQTNSGNFSKAPLLTSPSGIPFVFDPKKNKALISPVARPYMAYDTEKVFGESARELQAKWAPKIKEWVIDQNERIKEYNKYVRRLTPEKRKAEKRELLEKTTAEQFKKNIKLVIQDQLIGYDEAVKFILGTSIVPNE